MLKELALLFLRLGATAFGGPAAHIAIMEDEIVKRRHWLTHEYFLDLLGATNLIPGPNSTEMAIHIGYVRAGWKGLLVAGVCFILPAVAVTTALAWLYVTLGALPQVGRWMWGMRAGIIAVILGALVRLGRPLARKGTSIAVGLAVIALSLLHVDEIVLLLGGGVAGLLWSLRNRMSVDSLRHAALAPLALVPSLVQTASTGAQNPATLAGLGLFFLKIGSILFGSGYVLVAFLQGGLVDMRHWMTQSQLLDAIAVGQFTPGPVLSTASFIGYVILGVPGAVVSTLGIFLPSFVFVLITSPFVPKLRRSPLTGGFLDGVNAAALGLMAAVCIVLGHATLKGFPEWIVFAVSGIFLFWKNLHPAWIIAGSAAFGWFLTSFQ